MTFRYIACALILLAGGLLGARSVAAQADSTAHAADSSALTPPVRLILADGSRPVGHIEREDDEIVVLRTLSGVVLTIPRDQIVRREAYEALRQSSLAARLDPNRTRLLFAPTARGLRPGEGYVALYEVFFPFAAIGLHDAATLGAGFSLIPGSTNQLIYAAPKFSLVQGARFSAAVGVLAGGVLGEGVGGGLAYGVSTYEAGAAAFTGGIGFAFGGGEIAERPVILLGGEYQLARRTKLLTENYFVPGVDNGQVISVGLRLMGERLAGDFGIFTTPELIGSGAFNYLPWMSLAYNFGG